MSRSTHAPLQNRLLDIYVYRHVTWSRWAPTIGAVLVPRRVCAVALIAACGLSGRAQAAGVRDGSHDFDSEFGAWNVTVRRLIDTPNQRPHWERYTGTHVVRPLWGGRANLGVMEISGPAGHIEGMQIRLYDPSAHLWRLSFANSGDGQLQAPIVGAFRHGIGDFRAAERVHGRTVLTRAVSTPLCATSYRDVISISTNDGATWQTRWIAVYTRP
jgi:hypothetical protein